MADEQKSFLDTITLGSVARFVTKNTAMLGIFGSIAYFGADAYAENIIAKKGLMRSTQVEEMATKVRSLQLTTNALTETLDDVDTNSKSVKALADQIRSEQRELQGDIKDILKILSERR